jgi:hypothetical protein
MFCGPSRTLCEGEKKIHGVLVARKPNSEQSCGTKISENTLDRRILSFYSSLIVCLSVQQASPHVYAHCAKLYYFSQGTWYHDQAKSWVHCRMLCGPSSRWAKLKACSKPFSKHMIFSKCNIAKRAGAHIHTAHAQTQAYTRSGKYAYHTQKRLRVCDTFFGVCANEHLTRMCVCASCAVCLHTLTRSCISEKKSCMLSVESHITDPNLTLKSSEKNLSQL